MSEELDAKLCDDARRDKTLDLMEQADERERLKQLDELNLDGDYRVFRGGPEFTDLSEQDMEKLARQYDAGELHCTLSKAWRNYHE